MAHRKWLYLLHPHWSLPFPFSEIEKLKTIPELCVWNNEETKICACTKLKISLIEILNNEILKEDHVHLNLFMQDINPFVHWWIMMDICKGEVLSNHAILILKQIKEILLIIKIKEKWLNVLFCYTQFLPLFSQSRNLRSKWLMIRWFGTNKFKICAKYLWTALAL